MIKTTKNKSVKMDPIIKIKSQAGNRVRLKSKLFQTQDNINLIENALREAVYELRSNTKCSSIIFRHRSNITLEEILEKLCTLFQITPTKLSIAASQSIHSVDISCVGCKKRINDSQSLKRSFIEFAALSLFAGFIFVKEHILGVAVASSPFSLVGAVAVFAAVPLLKESYQDIKKKRFTLQTFMGATLIGAVLFGEVTAAFEIIYILRGGMLLEEYIAARSKKEIQNLVELDIKKLYVAKGEVEIEVDIDAVAKGDIVVVRSGEKIGVDGYIVDGSAEIDEAIINGRSEPSFKTIGDKVFAGTICQKGRILIEVQGVGSDTYVFRTMQQVQQSLANKSPSQVEADKLASKLLKLGSFLTVATFVATGSFANAFAVMIVMSCPCATVLAASTAISAGIFKGAKNGVFIKGAAALESVSQAEVYCFDKTGTLTTGKPVVSDIVVFDNMSEDEVISCVAQVEYRNPHPIAKSIVDYAKSRGLKIDQCTLSGIIPGYGVEAIIGEDSYLIGNTKLFSRHNISLNNYQKLYEKFLDEGKTVIFIAKNKSVIAMMAFVHEARAGTKQMIAALREKGVKHLVLLTGDEEKVAHSFAKEFDFDAIYASQSPQDKAAIIEMLKERFDKVVMVGDGVNDTYAMSKADLSISFAAGGSEAAIAVSDIAITHSYPKDVVFLYELSQKTLRVINQNYYLGTGTNLAGVALAAIGKLSPIAAGAIHIGHTVGIMANSSRLAYG